MDPTAQIRSADDAARYLDGLINRERTSDDARARTRFDLSAIRALLDAVGNPERQLSILHVAGSKGKGSVCLAAECVLRALGERVGTFTSPHLERWTERFRIDGREVSGEALARAVTRLRPHVEALRRDRPETAPSFFDATTAAALLLFAEAGVDRVLLEVGLGGRLDSTNAVTPQVTCVTQIELEHTQILGDTLSAIASEKAGILKAGIPCVVGALAPEADAVVRARAAELGSPVFALGEHFDLVVEPAGGGRVATRLRYRERTGFEVDLELPVVGRHQARNVGLALACVRRLEAHDDAALRASAIDGLSRLELPGRIEWIEPVERGAPRVVIDCAHTAASASGLAEALTELGIQGADFVLSVSQGKALEGILRPLVPLARRITLTRADPDRTLAPARLLEAIRVLAPDLAVRTEDDPAAAVRLALADASPADEPGTVVVTGSVYLVGIARQIVRAADAAGSAPSAPE